MDELYIDKLVSIEPPEARCIYREFYLAVVWVTFSSNESNKPTWPFLREATIGSNIDFCLLALLKCPTIFGKKAPTYYVGISDVVAESQLPLVDELESRRFILSCNTDHQPLLSDYLMSLQKYAPGWESRFPIGGLAMMLKEGSFQRILAGEITHRFPVNRRDEWSGEPVTAQWWQLEPPIRPDK
jgi:hypothetical protein